MTLSTIRIMKSFNVKRDFKIILLTLIYCLAAYFAFQLAFDTPLNIPVWPAAGIGLAFVILMGRDTWPAVALGTLLTQVFAYWHFAAITSEFMILIAVLTATGTTIQVLTGNYLYKKFISSKEKTPFSRSADSFTFLFIALFAGLIAPTMSTVSLYLTGVLRPEAILNTWFSWWVGNVVGILLFTPFILSWTRALKFRVTIEKLLEGLLFLICIAGLLALFRVDSLAGTVEKAFPFLVIPFLMWLAFRFRLNVALSVMVIVSISAVYRTTHGLGPFAVEDVYNSTLLLQAFVGVISISTLIISSTVTERNQIQKQLERFNENLESKVNERTKALNEEITIRAKAEEKLKISNRKLRKTNAELDNFVYSVSHDLRAPIASVLGLINLAKKDRSEEMAMKYLEMIEESAIQQDKFIKKILDQSRNARLDIRKEEIMFDRLISETFNQLKYVDLTGNVSKNININQDKPFFSDTWRLKVIFNNLLSNSIRYKNGNPPKIDIDINVENNDAHIVIRDNGKGIAKKHLRHVFKMFYRATDENAGSGLGLYIVKETVDKLHGAIKLSSNEGKGTEVDLHIPSLT